MWAIIGNTYICSSKTMGMGVCKFYIFTYTHRTHTYTYTYNIYRIHP